MQDFFLYRTELSMDKGFQLFGVCHILWILGIGIFSFFLGGFFSFSEKKKVETVKKILMLVFPLLEVSRLLVLAWMGRLTPSEYPLHLCNLSVWMAAIYLLTKNRFIGVIYVLLGLPAAALAIVFPGWLRYPFGTYMHMHNFIYHGLVVAFGGALIRSGEIRPSWRELWKPFIFGVIGYVVMSVVNRYLGTNFWFINTPSDSSPLAFIYNLFGDNWYLLGHFLFCGSVVLLWFLLVFWYQRAVSHKYKWD